MKKYTMVIAKCPLRVSLVGGSTDLQSFIDEYGYGKVISFPITLYTYISISPRHDKKYVVNYSAPESVTDPREIKNDIAKELISYFNLPPLTIAFNADISTTGSGLAASSSYMIAAIAAAAKFKGLELSQEKICRIAHEIELKFNPLTGYQDAYGCGLPSPKLMKFNKKGDVDIQFIDLPECKMFLYNTNAVRSSTDILKTIDIEKSFPLLELVDKVYHNLNDPDQFFQLLKDAWEAKKKTSKDILSDDFLVKLDKQMTSEPEVNFHKLCGAGGGGYFLTMTNSQPEEQNLIQIEVDEHGVQSWVV